MATFDAIVFSYVLFSLLVLKTSATKRNDTGFIQVTDLKFYSFDDEAYILFRPPNTSEDLNITFTLFVQSGKHDESDNMWDMYPCPMKARDEYIWCKPPNFAIIMYTFYNAFIQSTDFYGRSVNSSLIMFERTLSTTPAPARNFTVISCGQNHISIDCVFPKSAKSEYSDAKLLLFYTDMSRHSTKDLNCGSKCECEIFELTPYTEYKLYVQVVLNDDHYSTKNGPIYIRTTEGRPSEVPSIIKHENKTVKKGSRMVILHFEYPEKRKWNGKIRNVSFHVCKENKIGDGCEGQTLTKSIYDTNLTKVNISNLSTTQNYAVVTSMCTNGGCRKGSSVYRIESNVQIVGTSGNQVATPIIIGIGIVLFILIIIIILIWRKRRRDHRRRNIITMEPDDLSLYDTLMNDDSYCGTEGASNHGEFEQITERPCHNQVLSLREQLSVDMQSDTCSSAPSIEEVQGKPLIHVSADVHRDRSLSSVLSSSNMTTQDLHILRT